MMTRVILFRSVRRSKAIPEAALLPKNASILATPILSTILKLPLISKTSAPYKITSVTDHP